MQHILDLLNPAQREAVTTTEGPLLVIAGAGSGKTRVLTSRVAYILFKGLAEPGQLLAVTFTNKAANEMKERIAALLGVKMHRLAVSTFHSFCARLLRQEAHEFNYPSNFTIFDEDDAIALIKTCLDELNISRNQFPPPSLKRKISAAKNRQEDADGYAEKASGYFETRTAQVYTLYDRRLRECRAFDFDDLIFKTVRLLESRPDIRDRYRERFRYILVDEYQDTNHSQYLLLRLLTGDHRNICVVGDEDQSIYGWRGADISNILDFEKDFPGARIIKLEQNYRSTEVILKAASAVIANNVTRKGKTLWTEIARGDPLRLFLTGNASREAELIIGDIEQNRNDYPLKETVILYRTNAQSRPFEEHLRRRNIPYQIIGGVSFYQRKEIKDLLAYLKLIANPNDDVSLRRIINYPRRGVGQTSIEKLAAWARERGISMFGAASEIDNCPELGSRPRKLIAGFVELINHFREAKDRLDTAELTRQLVDKLKLTERLIEEDPLIGQSRVENIEEFISGATEFVLSSEQSSLDNFLAEITLYTDIDRYNEIEDKLTLMTLHAAKGLEFDSVYISGLEEGLFPLARTIDSPLELEEERRLFYVGATRARKRLQLSMAAYRGRFGDMESVPSRFLRELPPALVETSDLRNEYQRWDRPDRSGEKTSDAAGLRYEFEEEEIMQAGRIVAHPTFGRGRIIKAEGHGESLQLEIYFTGIGSKKIMARYAKLKIIG